MTKAKAPAVVLIGRTNAGKSTLFNRLTEGRKAIVSSAENTTRDQTRSMVYWKGNMCELIDTGGLDTAELDPLNKEIQRQVRMALDIAAAVIFVVDGKSELMPQDRETAQLLRDTGKPIILCVNKVDNNRYRQPIEATFSPLFNTALVSCSASNGTGTGDLLDVLFTHIPAVAAPEKLDETDQLILTIIGRPNVGKSTLFNALIGEDRVIVSDVAHTTRDINDTFLQFNDRRFKILDTAGIRRKNKVGQWKSSSINRKQLAQIEQFGVQAALQSIEECDVVALVVEAQQKVNRQDKVLVDHARRHGKGVMVVINKWDLVENKDSATINGYKEYFTELLNLSYVPLVFTSGLEKQRVTDILKTAIEIQGFREYQMSQADLDQVLYHINKQRPREKKKLIKGQPKKILELVSLKQVGINPPTFRLVATRPKNVAPAIMNLIEKGIREKAKYPGVYINVYITNS